MNFEFIPELSWPHGYTFFWLLALGIMLFGITAVTMTGVLRLPGMRTLRRRLVRWRAAAARRRRKR